MDVDVLGQVGSRLNHGPEASEESEMGQGSTAVVTGGAGFIGSHLVDALLGAGHHVVILDDLSSGSERNVAAEGDLEVVDVADMAALDQAMDTASPGVIFHLAAQSMVTVSVSDPQRDCRINVQGTLNVLEAARRHAAPVVFTSTGGALYGNDAPRPTPEDHPPAPVSPYGASKWSGEAYVQTWARASRLPHAICRLANVYGARQNAFGEAGVVAILSNLVWRGQSPTLYGQGKATRDYVHVSDVADALIRAEGHGGVFNISTARETEVNEIFELIRDASGQTVDPRLAPLREGELERSCMDPGRALRILGWSAQTRVDQGVSATYHQLVADWQG